MSPPTVNSPGWVSKKARCRPSHSQPWHSLTIAYCPVVACQDRDKLQHHPSARKASCRHIHDQRYLWGLGRAERPLGKDHSLLLALDLRKHFAHGQDSSFMRISRVRAHHIVQALRIVNQATVF